MNIKLLEIRDAGTTIPAMAIQFEARTEAERWLLGRSGYGLEPSDQSKYVLLSRLEGKLEIHYDPYGWSGQCRTMHVAHDWLVRNGWDSFESGDVIDVEFILGERPTKKLSERSVSL